MAQICTGYHPGKHPGINALDLPGLPLAELQAIEPRITAAVYDVLTPQASAASRMSYGGTSPEQVRAQVARWKEKLG